jgi:hypothetical protein
LRDTAELAICNVFGLDSGEQNDRLKNNSDKMILKRLKKHYSIINLYYFKTNKIFREQKRERGGHEKSGVDFLSQKTIRHYLAKPTNQNHSKFVPLKSDNLLQKTFDLHFSSKGWYDGNMDENLDFGKRQSKTFFTFK